MSDILLKYYEYISSNLFYDHELCNISWTDQINFPGCYEVDNGIKEEYFSKCFMHTYDQQTHVTYWRRKSKLYQVDIFYGAGTFSGGAVGVGAVGGGGVGGGAERGAGGGTGGGTGGGAGGVAYGVLLMSTISQRTLCQQYKKYT